MTASYLFATAPIAAETPMLALSDGHACAEGRKLCVSSNHYFCHALRIDPAVCRPVRLCDGHLGHAAAGRRGLPGGQRGLFRRVRDRQVGRAGRALAHLGKHPAADGPGMRLAGRRAGPAMAAPQVEQAVVPRALLGHGRAQRVRLRLAGVAAIWPPPALPDLPAASAARHRISKRLAVSAGMQHAICRTRPVRRIAQLVARTGQWLNASR